MASGERAAPTAGGPATAIGMARRIHHGARQPANWMQLLKFGLVGGSGYAVNLAVFAVLTHFAGLHHIAAAVAAFAVAVSNNFWWNRHWTFAAGDGHAGFQAARFFAVSLVGLALNLVLLELFVTGLELPELGAQAIAVALTMPVNFVGNKLWTFDV
jgi:putative flippase GtrA